MCGSMTGQIAVSIWGLFGVTLSFHQAVETAHAWETWSEASSCIWSWAPWAAFPGICALHTATLAAHKSS